MAMTTIKKVLKQTPLIGRVINSLKSDNPEENAPSIQAVLDNLQPRQLLINNDFQINQRWQTLYNGDYSKYTYTIDMWRIVTTSQSETCTLEKLAQGVKFSSNGTGRANFEQRIEVDISKNHTAACYIRNLVGNGIFAISVGSVWERTELKNGLNIISVPSGANADRCIVALLDTSNCEIEYIDLFEGDIVYPHVKKKYVDDLFECMYYVQIGRLITTPYGYKGSNVFYFRGMFNFPIRMKSNPIINYKYIDCVNIGELDESKIKNIVVSFDYVGGTIQVDLGTSEIDPSSYVKYPMYMYFTLSCEPL